MRTERFFQAHPVKLSDDEVTDRAAECANLLEQSEAKAREIEKHKEDAGAKKKALDAEKEGLDAKCYRLGRVVRTKQEERQVECEERDVMSTLTIETVRCDTDVVVGSRPMSKEEILDRQQIKIPLPGVGRGKKAAEPPVDDLVEVAKIADYLRGIVYAGLEATTEQIQSAAGVIANDAADRAAAVAYLRLEAKSRKHSEAVRAALGRALRDIEDGKHLAVKAPAN